MQLCLLAMTGLRQSSAGITSLSVVRFDERNLPFNPLPFSLTRLSLGSLPTPPFLNALLHPSITSLSIWLPRVELVHVPSFTRISHQLTYLRCLSSPANIVPLEPFFRGCANLSDLSINPRDLGSILSLIPSALESLTLGSIAPAVKDLSALRDLLRATPPARIVALSSLRLLRFELREQVVMRSEAGRELLEECEVKGIQVLFDV